MREEAREVAVRREAYAAQRPSRALLRFFDTYLSFFVSRRFHGLRLAGAEHWPRQRPLIVCLNHPSWWDPLIAILLSRFLEREADHYAPMDELAFTRYGVLRKAGLFPVEQGTPRGGVQFLRTATHVLADRNAVLWLTPQGGFTDARTRPVVLRSGLDALLRRVIADEVTVVPLALEYTFWDERLPEALAMLGTPLYFQQGKLVRPSRQFAEQQSAGQQVAMALSQTQDDLAALSARRDPALFLSLLAGSSGISGIYGAWQRMRALGRGERFHPDHTSVGVRSDDRHV